MNKNNVTLSIGSVALVDKVDAQYRVFDRLLHGIGGRAKHFMQSVKLFVNNRLGECFSTNRLVGGYDDEFFSLLGFESTPKERSLYRDLERLGKNYQFIMERYQSFLQEEGLLSSTQFIDFSASYFEGKACALGELGYSRDGQPGKKQITFGVSTGINGIPSALTIQKGNVQDKTHFRFMLKTAGAVLQSNSVLIFDCGGNTKENKRLIREKGFHYLTLKPKQQGPYRKALALFHAGLKVPVVLGERQYECVHVQNGEEWQYIYFSEQLKNEQLSIKTTRFERELSRNKPVLRKTKQGKVIEEYRTEEGVVTTKGTLQQTLATTNHLVTGLEGYFVLESSINTSPERVLALYKGKDKAEKLIRSIKEGTELRPMRHWSTSAVIGYVLVVFLTNFFTSLTLHNAREPVVKNVKLLKKYLAKLSLVIIYSSAGFKHAVLANICDEITSILGDFPSKYGKKSLPLQW